MLNMKLIFLSTLIAAALGDMSYLSDGSAHVVTMARDVARTFKNNMGEEASALTDLFEVNHLKQLVPKRRQKRIIELPHGLVFEMKWMIDVPFMTFTRFSTVWQFAVLINALYPAEVLQDAQDLKLTEIIHPLLNEIVQETFGHPPAASERITHGTTNANQDIKWYPGLNRNAEPSYDQPGSYYQPGVEQDMAGHIRSKRAAHKRDREHLYSFVGALMENSGLPGRQCLLRTICEVAEAPFQQQLLGDMINTIFTPSKAGFVSIEDTEYGDFLEAELYGLRNGTCHLKYRDCPEPIFSRLPFVEHTYKYI